MFERVRIALPFLGFLRNRFGDKMCGGYGRNTDGFVFIGLSRQVSCGVVCMQVGCERTGLIGSYLMVRMAGYASYRKSQAIGKC